MDIKTLETSMKKVDVCLDEWKQEVLKGKILLGEIIAKLYPMEKTREPNLDDRIQSLINSLDIVVKNMGSVVVQLEQLKGKFKALGDLNALKTGKENPGTVEIRKTLVDFSDIQLWVQTIFQNYQKQLEMNKVILSSICHLENREQALVHQGVWTLQPGVTSQTDLYISCLKHLVSLQT